MKDLSLVEELEKARLLVGRRELLAVLPSERLGLVRSGDQDL